MRSVLILTNNPKAELALKFKTTELDSNAHYLGVVILREENTITVHQTVYIDQLLKAHQMSNCNPTSTFIVKSSYLIPIVKNHVPNANNMFAYKQFTGCVQ